MTTSTKQKNKLLTLSWLPWFIIFFEMLYMASPFAIFFYSAYSMPLKLLNRSFIGSRLVQTILPHFVETKSALPQALALVAWPLMAVSIIVFFAAFFQIYYSKFTKKGAVTGGIYRFIRHPQYTAWTVFGLSMCAVWSRLIVWLMFVTMCFIYYSLARAEEEECMKKFPSYRSYHEKTGMFFPKIPILSLSRNILPQKKYQARLLAFSLYICTMIITIVTSQALRNWTISQMAHQEGANYYALSLNVINESTIAKTAQIVLGDYRVTAALDTDLSPDDKIMIYIMPSTWIVPELGMELVIHENESGSNPVGNLSHGNTADTDPLRKRVLISKAITAGNSGKSMFHDMVQHKPLLIAYVDLEKNTISELEKAPEKGKYGDIPVPVF